VERVRFGRHCEFLIVLLRGSGRYPQVVNYKGVRVFDPDFPPQVVNYKVFALD
jgi:hypothetical protein